MDAIEFLKKKSEMCLFYKENCRKCPLHGDCNFITSLRPSELVETVKKWNCVKEDEN